MHSFEVQSNERACKKSGPLGTEQVLSTAPIVMSSLLTITSMIKQQPRNASSTIFRIVAASIILDFPHISLGTHVSLFLLPSYPQNHSFDRPLNKEP